jgi:hypothetical protein
MRLHGMKKFRASLIILSVATLQGCCCGMSGFPGGKQIPNADLYWFFKRLNNEAVPVSASRPLAAVSDRVICKGATSSDGKFWAPPERQHVLDIVDEARRRGLSPDCRKIIFEAATDKKVCKLAVAKNGDWETKPDLFKWTAEAKRRGFVTETCTQIMADEYVCTFSIRNNEWATLRPHFVNEAKRRGLSPAKCTQIILAEQSSKQICMFAVRNDEWAVENLQFVKEAKRRGLSLAKCSFFQ